MRRGDEVIRTSSSAWCRENPHMVRYNQREPQLDLKAASMKQSQQRLWHSHLRSPRTDYVWRFHRHQRPSPRRATSSQPVTRTAHKGPLNRTLSIRTQPFPSACDVEQTTFVPHSPSLAANGLCCVVSSLVQQWPTPQRVTSSQPVTRRAHETHSSPHSIN